ncbi:C-type lectin domain family 6 member A-like isoform X1 [Myripristis murdjan]|uniref:C-type lectin domain family 6 member A-like isoform X1 n=1 Tax=Myripristis murdjan TaxID=586833 RepID=UPI001175E78B|nr:C-type lectin domain family 6 member A-like isoform X1 [Myripristis murdjan]
MKPYDGFGRTETRPSSPLVNNSHAGLFFMADESMAVNNGPAKQQQASTEKDWWKTPQLAYYFSLLCFLLTVATLFQTFYMMQITWLFQSQSALQEAAVRDLTHKLERLNQSHRRLFSQYPALNQYCTPANSTSTELQCRPCLANWTSQGERCYLFSQDRADWISSQYRCMTAGGTLVTVRTEEEQIFLWKKAQSLSQGDSYWLGLRSGTPAGGWQWSDGSPLDKGPQFWQQEPDEGDSRELCGRLSPGDRHQAAWGSSSCSSRLRSICERRQASLQ